MVVVPRTPISWIKLRDCGQTYHCLPSTFSRPAWRFTCRHGLPEVLSTVWSWSRSSSNNSRVSLTNLSPLLIILFQSSLAPLHIHFCPWRSPRLILRSFGFHPKIYRGWNDQRHGAIRDQICQIFNLHQLGDICGELCPGNGARFGNGGINVLSCRRSLALVHDGSGHQMLWGSWCTSKNAIRSHLDQAEVLSSGSFGLDRDFLRALVFDGRRNGVGVSLLLRLPHVPWYESRKLKILGAIIPLQPVHPLSKLQKVGKLTF